MTYNKKQLQIIILESWIVFIKIKQTITVTDVISILMSEKLKNSND